MQKSSCGHHFCQFLGYSLLKGVNEDIVSSDTTLGLSKPECHHIVIEVSSVILVHREGVEFLVSLICEILWYEGLGEVFIWFLKGFLAERDYIVLELQVPPLHKGGALSLTHLVE